MAVLGRWVREIVVRLELRLERRVVMLVCTIFGFVGLFIEFVGIFRKVIGEREE